MVNRRRFVSGLVAACLGQSVCATPVSETLCEQLQAIDANVVLMRHALAPGFGDPKTFDLTHCNTQRNLDHQGREQAITLGRKFKDAGIKFDAVYSSQWCRCLDTAHLLSLGPVQPFAGLNSFFQSYAERGETLRKLDQRVATLNTSSLSLMVTHQVVIRAVTKQTVSSGACVAYNSQTKRTVNLTLA